MRSLEPGCLWWVKKAAPMLILLSFNMTNETTRQGLGFPVQAHCDLSSGYWRYLGNVRYLLGSHGIIDSVPGLTIKSECRPSGQTPFIVSQQSPKEKFQVIVIGDLCGARRPITSISDRDPQQGYGWSK